MILVEHNDVQCIVAGDNESFWQLVAHRLGSRPRPPVLHDFLKEWWDNTAPGEWTTAYLERTPCICVRDPKLFLLFKLAWSGKIEIARPEIGDYAAFYCPYVPLTMSKVIPVGSTNTPIINPDDPEA